MDYKLQSIYDPVKYPFQEEIDKILKICVEVHKILGKGMLEVVYKDALELEFKNAGIDFEREKNYEINYKGVILPHKYFADFVVMNNIILEIKASNAVAETFGKQILNYLTISKCKVGLIINFGEEKLKVKKYIM